jgi:hypothetical protein
MPPAADHFSVSRLVLLYRRAGVAPDDYREAVSTAADLIINALIATGFAEAESPPGVIALARQEQGSELLGIMTEPVPQTTTFLLQLATSFDWGALSLIT